MTAFAFIDENGLPTGGGIGPLLPKGAIALAPPFTTEDLARIMWRDGFWVERPVEPQEQPSALDTAVQAAAWLQKARAEALRRITAQVGALRASIYTDITGQDALYLEKRAEAVAYLAQTERQGHEPATLADYPLLDNEVGTTAPTPWQLAQIWLHRSDQFKALGAATEKLRMQAGIAIAEARDEPELERITVRFMTALGTLTP